MRSTQKERVKPGEHAGDTGTRSCVRATASVLQERDEKKRPGWSWGGRGKRETVRLPPPTPGKHLQALDPAPHLPWSPRGPSLVLLLAPVALSFATSLVLLFWGVFFFWFSLFLNFFFFYSFFRLFLGFYRFFSFLFFFHLRLFWFSFFLFIFF